MVHYHNSEFKFNDMSITFTLKWSRLVYHLPDLFPTFSLPLSYLPSFLPTFLSICLPTRLPSYPHPVSSPPPTFSSPLNVHNFLLGFVLTLRQSIEKRNDSNIWKCNFSVFAFWNPFILFSFSDPFSFNIIATSRDEKEIRSARGNSIQEWNIQGSYAFVGTIIERKFQYIIISYIGIKFLFCCSLFSIYLWFFRILNCSVEEASLNKKAL